MSEGWNPLAKLVCGQPESGISEISDIIIRLGNTITEFSNRIIEYEYTEESEIINIPFYARSIMEAACTALVARMDPFRVLIIYKVQSSTEYDITKKSNASIQWTGDIIAASKPKANLWSPENKLEDYNRALLSNYNGELLWKPSFLKAIDYIDTLQASTDWLIKLKEMDENQFFERSKTEALKLYSSFSKGIHYEFLVNLDSMYDATTVQSLVNRMFEILAELALVSHFSGWMLGKIEYQVCVQSFTQIEELIKIDSGE